MKGIEPYLKSKAFIVGEEKIAKSTILHEDRS